MIRSEFTNDSELYHGNRVPFVPRYGAGSSVNGMIDTRYGALMPRLAVNLVGKALKLELAAVLTELKRIEAGNSVDEELMNVIELIAIILGGLKGEDENGE